MITLINLWEKDKFEFGSKIARLDEVFFNGEELVRVHIDLQERGFGDVETVVPEEWGGFPDFAEVDVHLMVEKPEEWLDRVCQKNVKRVLGHVEKIADVGGWVKLCGEHGVVPGLVVDIGTEAGSWNMECGMGNEEGGGPRVKINPFVELVDACKDVCSADFLVVKRPQILVMGYKAGRLNQHFNESVLSKVMQLRELVGDNAEIIVDGGINLDLAKRCKQAGADGVAVYGWLLADFPKRYWELVEV